MKKVLITGASGFVGGHLAKLAKSQGHIVIGMSSTPAQIESNFDDFVIHDLSISMPAVPEVDWIVHLAGLSAVSPSFLDPQKYIEVNSRIVTNLCEALLEKGSKPRVLAVSSGAVYQSTAERLSENSKTDAYSPYGVSKILVESQISYYLKRGLDAVIARPFNHIGPGQSTGFLVADMYEKLRKNQHQIEVGNLASIRDYSDVRDVCGAYLALCDSMAQGTYNVCSGNGISGYEILELLCTAMGIPKPLPITANGRLTDQNVMVGNNAAIRKATGWSPSIPAWQSIVDFVEAKKL